MRKRTKVALLAGVAAAVVATALIRGGRLAPRPTPFDARHADALPKLDGYPFGVRYSEGARAQAVRLADLAKDAYTYFVQVFPRSSPTFTAWMLAPNDWQQGYGMPSYHPVQHRLRVATDDNPFWQSFGRIARIASPLDAYPRLEKTYADGEGRLQLRRFFDLLVVHELAHAFEEEGGAAFPTHWLREVFADLALHAFVAKARPSELGNLTAFPEAQRRIGVFNATMRLGGYTSLDDFDRHYPAENPGMAMSGPNYGWYQIRFHVLAREVFDEGGEAALGRLWAFGLSEAAHRQRASDYRREHGALTGWSDGIRAADLAPRLGAEVSPRLGQAIASWR